MSLREVTTEYQGAGSTELAEDDAFSDAFSEAYSAVASLLWNEREALEHVHFKLLQEQLLLEAGQSRWLAKADAEVIEAVRRMRMSEVLRVAETERIVAELGLPIDATLAQIAESAPEPWGLVLAEHRTALRSLVAEIQATTTNVRVLLHAGVNAIRETLDLLTSSVTTYNADGAQVERDFGSLLLDEQA